MVSNEVRYLLRHKPDPELVDTEAQEIILALLDHIDEIEKARSGDGQYSPE